MADFALLDEMGFPKLFYYRREVSKYRGLGFSDDELEEIASDILIEAYLNTDFTQYSQKKFCSYCKTKLREIRRLNRLRFEPTQKRTQVELESVADVSLSEDTLASVDSQFLEKWDLFLAEVFPKPKDLANREIAKRHFLRGETFQALADALGFKSRQAVQRRVESIRRRICDYVSGHTDRVYSYFDINAADAIIEFAKA